MTNTNFYKNIILGQVDKFKNFEDYAQHQYGTLEDIESDFQENLDGGYIQELTKGSYNGATQEFSPWELTDSSLIDTLHYAMEEEEFIENACENGLLDTEKIKDSLDIELIYEYVICGAYRFFTIGKRVFLEYT